MSRRAPVALGLVLSASLGCRPPPSTPPRPTSPASVAREPGPTPEREPPWRLVQTEHGPHAVLLDVESETEQDVGELVAEVELDGTGPAELVVASDHHWSGTNIDVHRHDDQGWHTVFGTYLFELRVTPSTTGGGSDLLVFRDEENRWTSSGALTCTRFGWDAAHREYVPTAGACNAELGTRIHPAEPPEAQIVKRCLALCPFETGSSLARFTALVTQEMPAAAGMPVTLTF